MAKANNTPLERTFKLERESKNKKRFLEQAPEDEQAIGILYVTKSRLKDWGDPDELELSLKPKAKG